MAIRFGRGINKGVVMHFQYTQEQVDEMEETYKRLEGIRDDLKKRLDSAEQENEALEGMANRFADRQIEILNNEAKKDYENFSSIKTKEYDDMLSSSIAECEKEHEEKVKELLSDLNECIEDVTEQNREELQDEIENLLSNYENAIEENSYSRDDYYEEYYEENELDTESLEESYEQAEMMAFEAKADWIAAQQELLDVDSGI